jgi:CheY-like chemotaxis protein
MDGDEGKPAESETPLGILLVDDDERVLKFVSKMLLSFGQDEIYLAASAQQAFKIWSEKASKIGLVITDFVMPCVTGDAMAQQMIGERASIKVLFISGNDPSSLNSKIPLRPGKNFLQKPFTIADLRQMLQSMAPA